MLSNNILSAFTTVFGKSQNTSISNSIGKLLSTENVTRELQAETAEIATPSLLKDLVVNTKRSNKLLQKVISAIEDGTYTQPQNSIVNTINAQPQESKGGIIDTVKDVFGTVGLYKALTGIFTRSAATAAVEGGAIATGAIEGSALAGTALSATAAIPLTVAALTGTAIGKGIYDKFAVQIQDMLEAVFPTKEITDANKSIFESVIDAASNLGNRMFNGSVQKKEPTTKQDSKYYATMQTYSLPSNKADVTVNKDNTTTIHQQKDSDIKAMQSGTVTKVDNGTVTMQHTDGSVSTYTNITNSNIKEGDTIEGGTVIGKTSGDSNVSISNNGVNKDLNKIYNFKEWNVKQQQSQNNKGSLADAIQMGESRSHGYEDAVDYNRLGGRKLTEMSVEEVMQFQRGGNSAVGRYQMMKDKLPAAIKAGIIKPTDKFDANTQDKLGNALLESQANATEYYDARDAYKAGKITKEEYVKHLDKFQYGVASIWAGLKDKDGKGHYDKLNGPVRNKATVDSDVVRNAIEISKRGDITGTINGEGSSTVNTAADISLGNKQYATDVQTLQKPTTINSTVTKDISSTLESFGTNSTNNLKDINNTLATLPQQNQQPIVIQQGTKEGKLTNGSNQINNRPTPSSARNQDTVINRLLDSYFCFGIA